MAGSEAATGAAAQGRRFVAVGSVSQSYTPPSTEDRLTRSHTGSQGRTYHTGGFGWPVYVRFTEPENKLEEGDTKKAQL